MIKVENVSKSFTLNNNKIDILNNLSVNIKEGEKVAIIGPSGSGKSTLLSIMSGMDKPDRGKVLLDNNDIVLMSEQQLCKIRNKDIGIIFQAFELIPSFTALENVMLPLDIADKSDEKKATELLNRLGLGARLDHLPRALSGGEQQRVAIGRALINQPKVIFADEPTGNLDRQTGNKVLEILLEQIKQENKTLIIITHDINLANKMDRIFALNDGKLTEVNEQNNL
ncbi:MAG: ABC transporter ATP-binding protein [Candidatus Sericytochromatia bacterium]|nr:ABC transporter ATP-binding protein [Candidatus Sericytochromatia bacterium]